MKVTNPIDKEVYIVYKGTKYSVEANGTTPGIPAEVAEQWKKTHEFLEFTDTESPKIDEDNLDISKMKRADLEEVARGADIDPDEYPKVSDLREAIDEKLNA